jgi:phosphoesterase RecJ-like protein
MPDGDSIGSSLAMRLLLAGIGLETRNLTVDRIPRIYSFLPGVEHFITYTGQQEEFDVAVVIDCTDLDRLGGDLGQFISKLPVVVNIDHHISNLEFGTYNYIDPGAAAAGEIVFRLIAELKAELTPDIAVNLYTALTMDTGSFKFDNTTDKTHYIAADLYQTGIDIAEINRHLFANKDFIQLKLLGYALAQLKTTAEGRIAWITIPLKVFHELEAQEEHADGIINYPRKVNGAEVGILIREISPGKVKVGFRSKNLVDVNLLAAKFGGGGHPKASGCTIEGTIEEVEKQVIDMSIHHLPKE